MEVTAEQLAALVKGVVDGDGTTVINNYSKIEEATKGCLTFLANPKYTHYIYTTKASAVLVRKDFKPEHPVSATMIRVDDPYATLADLLNYVNSQAPQKVGVEQPCHISDGVELQEGAYIGAFAYIGAGVKLGKNVKIYPQVYVGDNVEIGDDVVLYPGVKVYHGCKIGNRCIVQGGATIGGDGFGFAPQADGTYEKISQIGIVILEDDVEIGANTTIDRATMGATIIHKGVKLDNLIQVAHNCEIGENTVMSAQVGMAGSTKIGAWCMVGGQAGFAGHIHIADKTFIGAQAGVLGNTKGNGEQLIGSPAIEPKGFFKSSAVFRKLPEMYRELNMLRKELDELKKQK